MPQEVAPIGVRPSTLSGISEQMVVDHYENHYGNAVRALNDVRRELAALDAGATPNQLGRLKREELSLMGSVALHELYFANLGGFRRAGPNSGLGRPDWHEVPDAFAAEIAAEFGSASAWRREFVAMAQSLAGGSGWVLLTYSRRQKRFWNQIATEHAQSAVGVRCCVHPDVLPAGARQQLLRCGPLLAEGRAVDLPHAARSQAPEEQPHHAATVRSE